ncbi:MAG: CBS domain-containing protein [Steroidobacteraceae bacterium]
MRPQDRISLLMTEEVLSVAIDEPAGEVLRLFAGYPVHHLPVLRGREVVGMLSSADVMKLEHFVPRGSVGAGAQEYLNQRMTVAALVRRAPVTVRAEQTVQDAAELMAGHGIHALPVVDSQQHLVGIVTTSDLIAAALQVAPAPGAAAPPAAAAAATTDSAAPSATDPHVPCDPQRIAALEKVLEAAERYVSAGQSAQLHTELLRAIERARRATTAPG